MIEDINYKNELDKYQFFKIASDVAFKNNLKLYIVGGYVRDMLLGKEREEIDFLVIGNGIEFANNFASELGIKKVAVYKNFGTAHFKHDNMLFEFVGARKESYNKDSRNPDVETGTYQDDMNRRDFTINALTLSLNKEDYAELNDPFNGVADLHEQIIKTPLDPFKTFDDDPLRILRAFRFASKLDFVVDESILDAASQMKDRLKIVSQERITDEFLKTLQTEKPSVGLKLMYETGVMEVIFPEVANLAGVDQRKDYHHKDVFLHTLKVVDNISQNTDNVWLRFAALMHDIAKPRTKRFVEGVGWTFHGHEEIGARMMKKIFKRMKLPFNQMDYVENLVRLHLRPIALVNENVTDSAIRRFIVAADEALEDLITLCRADITSKNQYKINKYLNNYEIVMGKVRDVKERDHLRAFQSPVRGDEIMSVCNLKPSKKVGLIKTAIEEAILDGIIPNTYEASYNYMLEIKDEILAEN